ncbi:MAG TPA: phosphoribosylamine--glycine ligase [Pirellulaceae bacterium]|jgi:phosphoribosylamine--glycine ligase|nr:phosphoribosylamine--glycine ligase [Pirellulaceae bacterium]
MKILVVGQGGREHALAWKLKQSPRVDQVFIAPGNAGTAEEGENVPIKSDDLAGLVRFAKKNEIGLTVVGPEAPLTMGIVDVFRKEGLKAFGPSKAAAQLEGSKIFCKQKLHDADVPTAEWQVFRNAESAETYITDRYPPEATDCPVVVKADGLAAGKGAIVCRTPADALDAIDRIARRKEFGSAGDKLVIEERLDGEEVSILALTDGKTIFTLPQAQDHKAAFDDDRGPNTGGMGAYSPAKILSREQTGWVEEHILVPTIHTMKRAKTPFQGILYAGLMMTNQGPKVLEYNVRFGDPECQPILMRLKTDLLELLLATVEGRLEDIDSLEWDERPSVCVVMASEGYPDEYKKGLPIRGLEDAAQVEDVKVFHSGTTIKDGQVVTDGGRVLTVTAIGESISKAKLNAYTAVRKIRWPGAWSRKDISDKALRRV